MVGQPTAPPCVSPGMDLHLPAVVTAAALLLTACSAGTSREDVAPPPSSSPTAPATTGAPGSPRGPYAAGGARPRPWSTVRGRGSSRPASAVTGRRAPSPPCEQVPPAQGRHDHVLASSDDGFASGDYRVVDQGDGLAAIEPVRRC